MAGAVPLLVLVLLSCCFSLPLVSIASEPEPKCLYDIQIQTSCGHFWNGYGTDGDVTVVVADSWNNGPSGNYAYFNSLDNPGNDFENCNLDKYTRGDQPCINFCSMRLSLRASAGEPAADWHVDYVKVSNTNVTLEFPVGDWLRPKRPGGGDFEANLC